MTELLPLLLALACPLGMVAMMAVPALPRWIKRRRAGARPHTTAVPAALWTQGPDREGGR